MGAILATDGDKKRVFEVKSEHFDTFLKASCFMFCMFPVTFLFVTDLSVIYFRYETG